MSLVPRSNGIIVTFVVPSPIVAPHAQVHFFSVKLVNHSLGVVCDHSFAQKTNNRWHSAKCHVRLVFLETTAHILVVRIVPMCVIGVVSRRHPVGIGGDRATLARGLSTVTRSFVTHVT